MDWISMTEIFRSNGSEIERGLRALIDQYGQKWASSENSIEVRDE